MPPLSELIGFDNSIMLQTFGIFMVLVLSLALLTTLAWVIYKALAFLAVRLIFRRKQLKVSRAVYPRRPVLY